MSTNIKPGKTESLIDDVAITAKIKAKFAVDDLVKALRVHVETTNRKVRLSGYVGSERAKNQAVKIANDTAGVEKVDASKLKVA